MRKTAAWMGLLLLTASLLPAYSPLQDDEELFQEAKVLIFDKRWEDAERVLDRLMRDHPDSRLFSNALFYQGRCLKEQRGKEIRALEVFNRHLDRRDANRDLVRESHIEIINLALNLYERGRRSYVREIEDRLDSRDRMVRHYAAIRLSYVKDKRISSKALPVLRAILGDEGSEELRDRARLAIMRIDPTALGEVEERGFGPAGAILSIRAVNKRSGRTTLTLDIPWALADLALSAIPEREKAIMRREGYDLDRIIQELTRFRGNIIEFEDADSLIKIWIK